MSKYGKVKITTNTLSLYLYLMLSYITLQTLIHNIKILSLLEEKTSKGVVLNWEVEYCFKC